MNTVHITGFFGFPSGLNQFVAEPTRAVFSFFVPRTLFLWQGNFSQLPLPMRITFLLVALGSAYAVWVLVLRNRLINPLKVTAEDQARATRLATNAGLGEAIPTARGALWRINLQSADQEQALSAVQCYAGGVVIVSVRNQLWQTEVVIPYSQIEVARYYEERDLTGLRAALLGPLAFLVQIKRYFLGIAYRTPDGEVRQILLEGKKSVAHSLAESLKAWNKPQNAASETPQ